MLKKTRDRCRFANEDKGASRIAILDYGLAKMDYGFVNRKLTPYNRLRTAYNGLRIAYNGLRIAYNGLRIAYNRLRTRYNGLWMIAKNDFEILKIRNLTPLKGTTTTRDYLGRLDLHIALPPFSPSPQILDPFIPHPCGV